MGFAEKPQDWFAAFDVFVSSAREESFGLVMLEAAAAGLPIIATATEGGIWPMTWWRPSCPWKTRLHWPRLCGMRLRKGRSADKRTCLRCGNERCRDLSFYQRERSVVVKAGA